MRRLGELVDLYKYSNVERRTSNVKRIECKVQNLMSHEYLYTDVEFSAFTACMLYSFILKDYVYLCTYLHEERNAQEAGS